MSYSKPLSIVKSIKLNLIEIIKSNLIFNPAIILALVLIILLVLSRGPLAGLGK